MLQTYCMNFSPIKQFIIYRMEICWKAITLAFMCLSLSLHSLHICLCQELLEEAILKKHTWEFHNMLEGSIISSNTINSQHVQFVSRCLFDIKYYVLNLGFLIDHLSLKPYWCSLTGLNSRSESIKLGHIFFYKPVCLSLFKGSHMKTDKPISRFEIPIQINPELCLLAHINLVCLISSGSLDYAFNVFLRTLFAY